MNFSALRQICSRGYIRCTTNKVLIIHYVSLSLVDRILQAIVTANGLLLDNFCEKIDENLEGAWNCGWELSSFVLKRQHGFLEVIYQTATFVVVSSFHFK